jgi:macrodomain Ter protein organizer (MatP/YcbG family)
MTLADTRPFYLEKEELLETCETELEELKEAKEGRDWIRLPHLGNTDYLSAQEAILHHRKFHFSAREIHRRKVTICQAKVPLFIFYCCSKIHLA